MLEKNTVFENTHSHRYLLDAPLPVAVFTGPQLSILEANKKFVELVGRSIYDLKGLTLDDVCRHNDIKTLTEELRKAISQEGDTYEVQEAEIIAPVGHKWCNLSCRHVRVSEGIDGVLVFFSDITQHVYARRRLEQNKNQFVDFVRYAPVGIVVYQGSDFRVQVANDKVLEIWGKSLDDVIGKPLSAIFPEIDTDPKARERYDFLVTKFIAGERIVVSETEQTFIKNGSAYRGWFSYTHEPIRDENNTITGVIAIVTEVTAQVLARQKAEEASKKLSLVTDAIPSLITYVNKDEIYEFNNKAYEDWFGYSASYVTGKSLKEVVGEESYEKIKDHVARVLAGEGHSFESWINYQGAGRRFVSATYLPHMNEHRETVGFFGLITDLTERKINEDAIAERERQLHSLSQNLEHQIRTRTAELSELNNLLTTRNDELHHTQAFLQQLLDSSVELIVVADRELKFVLVNRAFELFTGRSRSELIGKQILDLYPMYKGSDHIRMLQQTLHGESFHLRQNPSNTRTGVWFDTHYEPLRIDGVVTGVIAMSRNVTSIIKSEHQLAKLNQQLSEAQRLAKMGSFEWDFKTDEIHWSDEMFRIYGYEERFSVTYERATERMTPAEAEFLRTERMGQFQIAAENFRSKGIRFHELPPNEFPIYLPDGTTKFLRSSATLELSPTGEPEKLLGVMQDITHLKEKERQIELKNLELEEKNKELESFNYVASHDLQEPLRKIRTFIDRIAILELHDDILLNYLQKIDRSATRMSDLIQSMLRFSRLSNVTTEFSEVDLNGVLFDVLSDLELQVKEKNASILSDPLPTIKGSAYQMNQLFANLISNSLKFTRSTPTISIQASQEEMPNTNEEGRGPRLFWRLTFTDNGVGFDARYKSQIFGLFQRLHPKHEFGGTGVGLSIVKKIVERHNGYIDVESEEGRGTKFIVWLPCDI